jgi:hypothetical protein
MDLQQEFNFTLPKGYVDEGGQLHKTGVMRLATAADEILPLRDPRVQQNSAYLSVVLMARVITKLGSLNAIDTRVIEKLYTADMAYLQNLYQQINAVEPQKIDVICSSCQAKTEVLLPFLEV